MLQSNKKGGIRIGDYEGLRKYVVKALQRCCSELDEARIVEIETFLMERYWCKEKNIPTSKGDPAIKWALREKLQDVGFRNNTVSTILNDDGEEVDIFEVLGKNDSRYTEIEQWHDICSTIGAEPARALLFSLYNYTECEQKDEKKEKTQQGVLFIDLEEA